MRTRAAKSGADVASTWRRDGRSSARSVNDSSAGLQQTTLAAAPTMIERHRPRAAPRGPRGARCHRAAVVRLRRWMGMSLSKSPAWRVTLRRGGAGCEGGRSDQSRLATRRPHRRRGAPPATRTRQAPPATCRAETIRLTTHRGHAPPPEGVLAGAAIAAGAEVAAADAAETAVVKVKVVAEAAEVWARPCGCLPRDL